MARIRRKWTQEEDALLRSAVKTAQGESRPLLWRKLAKCVPGRTNKDCRRRWWNTLANGTAKGSWAEEEDERLIAAVSKYGTNWIRVSCDVGSRSPDQCSSHWSQVLDPNINYCDWTAEEDGNLLHAVLTYGTNWATIVSSHRPNRTTLALRNRYSTLRLQNNNNIRNKASADATKKVHDDLSSLSGTTMATSTKEVDWNSEAAKYSNWNEREGGSQSSDEDDGDEDEDEEDDEEENEPEDNDHEENGDDVLHHNGTTSCMELMPNLQGAKDNTGGRPIQSPNSSLTSWDTWAVPNLASANSILYKTQPISTEQPVVDRANHMQHQTGFGFNNPTQYMTTGESSFYSVPDPGPLITCEPKTIFDSRSKDIDLNTSLGTFRNSSQSLRTPPTTSNVTVAEASPAQTSSADTAASKRTSMSTSTSTRKSPDTSISSAQSSGFQSTTLYHVSMSMACTRRQLDANISLLIGMGTSVKIQIDNKSQVLEHVQETLE